MTAPTESAEPSAELARKNVFSAGGLGLRKERAVLLSVLPRGDPRRRMADPLTELRLLADTAEIEVADEVIQRVDKVNPSTYAGSGTVEKVSELAQQTGADTILCDNDLSPAQLRTMEKLCQRKVVDRTDLILDIFARHARTLQASLQVELAQLEYARPRLRKMWTHLAGEQGGIGFRGPGEKQLELDRRMIDTRIRELKARLEEIRKRKEREVSTRSEIHTVALVGYTNAGKSTLFRALTAEEDTYIADKLFATLDTKTRLFPVVPRVRATLSDTVGFIDHLPHRLVESFHATLEEVLQAELLIHVVDVSIEDPLAAMASVEAVLTKIGCSGQPVIVALNKKDRADPAMLPYFSSRIANSIPISALTGEGIPELRQAVAQVLTRHDRRCRIFCPSWEGRFIAAVDARASELERRVEGDDIVLDVRISEAYLEQALRYANQRRAVRLQWLEKTAPTI